MVIFVPVLQLYLLRFFILFGSHEMFTRNRKITSLALVDIHDKDI